MCRYASRQVRKRVWTMLSYPNGKLVSFTFEKLDASFPRRCHKISAKLSWLVQEIQTRKSFYSWLRLDSILCNFSMQFFLRLEPSGLCPWAHRWVCRFPRRDRTIAPLELQKNSMSCLSKIGKATVGNFTFCGFFCNMRFTWRLRIFRNNLSQVNYLKSIKKYKIKIPLIRGIFII